VQKIIAGRSLRACRKEGEEEEEEEKQREKEDEKRLRGREAEEEEMNEPGIKGGKEER